MSGTALCNERLRRFFTGGVSSSSVGDEVCSLNSSYDTMTLSLNSEGGGDESVCLSCSEDGSEPVNQHPGETSYEGETDTNSVTDLDLQAKRQSKNFVPLVIRIFDKSGKCLLHKSYEFPGHLTMRKVLSLVRTWVEVEERQAFVYSAEGEFLSPKDILKDLHLIYKKDDNRLHLKFKMVKTTSHYSKE